MSENPYESEKFLSEYLLLHFGGANLVFGKVPGPHSALHFSHRCVSDLIAPDRNLDAALDIGCAVGGSSFELTRHCSGVLGVDFSENFIRAANVLRTEGRHAGERLMEGEITEPFTVEVPAEIDRRRVRFEVGDACNLRDGLGGFDVVLAANLICRLPDPSAFLQRAPYLLRSGGQLLLTTPFTWLEEYTPREQWLGGKIDGPRSLDVLQEKLSAHFDLELQTDLPFVIREHARKFQYGVACGTRWRKK